MPYSNPIVGGTSLVRPAINSPGYVPGVTGWSINVDGTAEFSNATVRGTFLIGIPGTTSYITISGTVPVELVTYYSTRLSTLASFVIIMAPDNSGDYRYEIVGKSITAPTVDYYGTGWVQGGVVTEFQSTQNVNGVGGRITNFNHLSGGVAGQEAAWIFGFSIAGGVTPNIFNVFQSAVNFGTAITDIGSVTVWTPFVSNNDFSINEGFRIDGIDAPRGVIYYEQATGNNTSGAVAGTENLMRTTAGSPTFNPGRAYRVRWRGNASSAVIQNPLWAIRKTNLAGTLLIGNVARYPLPFAAQNTALDITGIIVNNTAAGITAALALTVTPQVATAVALQAAGAAGTESWEITDIGSTIDYTGVSV